MHIANYLGLLHKAEADLVSALHEIGDAHREEPDVFHECRLMASQCQHHAERLQPFAERYGEDADDEPDRLHTELFGGARSGGLGLLRDLHDLYLMITQCDLSWIVIGQAAQGLRDLELLTVVQECEQECGIQLKWLRTRMKHAAPQALVVS